MKLELVPVNSRWLAADHQRAPRRGRSCSDGRVVRQTPLKGRVVVAHGAAHVRAATGGIIGASFKSGRRTRRLLRVTVRGRRDPEALATGGGRLARQPSPAAPASIDGKTRSLAGKLLLAPRCSIAMPRKRTRAYEEMRSRKSWWEPRSRQKLHVSRRATDPPGLYHRAATYRNVGDHRRDRRRGTGRAGVGHLALHRKPEKTRGAYDGTRM